jgi:DNA primase
LKKEYVLYGEHKINRDLDTAIIVEGPLDALHLWQFGYDNVLALQGSDPSVKQLRKLVHFFRNIIVFVDADKAGKKMGEKVVQKLWNSMEDVCVVGGMKDDGKDPADRSQAEVYMMLLGKASPCRRF